MSFCNEVIPNALACLVSKSFSVLGLWCYAAGHLFRRDKRVTALTLIKLVGRREQSFVGPGWVQLPLAGQAELFDKINDPLAAVTTLISPDSISTHALFR